MKKIDIQSIQVSMYPKETDIHVSKYPCIHVSTISKYPLIQVSKKYQYPRYPSIQISEKSGIRPSLIMTVSSDKNPENTGGYTPLHSAAEIAHVELCRLIMDEIKDIFPKITPLHLATRGGHTAVKDLIIEYVEKN